MADSTPLLSNEPPKLVDHKGVPVNSLDSVIEKFVGDEFRWAVFLQAVLVSFAWFFDAQQSFITIFADAEASWHCEAQANNTTCSSVSDVCELARDSWAWDVSAEASTVSEWGLHCSGTVVKGLPASAFFLGSFLGGLTLTTVADSSLGRKKMLVFSCVATSVFTLLTALSANVWMYSALRFVSGFSRTAIGTCALVLPTELVGKRWRGLVGVLGFIFFTLGFLSLPVIAYPNRGNSWRNLYVWTSIPTFFYCLALHFLVSESPRWLFIRGRQQEAIETLRAMAPNIYIPNSNIVKIFSNMPLDDQQEALNSDLYSAIKILVAKKWAIRRLLAVMTLGFGIGLVYYGMPLALGNLDISLYLSVTFNALSEIPASLATYYLVAKTDRKTSILVLTLSSGLSSILSAFKGHGLLWTRLRVVFELVSFFGACTAIDLLLIFAVELFPTSIRNSAVSIARQAMGLGGVVGPLLAAAGRGDHGMLSYGVFGVAIGVFGLFVLCLPETRGTVLCDTMDDEERKEEAAKCHGSAIRSSNFVV